jgi:ABC-2 type transport system permease protein
MSVLAAERIKLLSTRSPWWTGAAAIAVVVGLTALIASFSGSAAAAGAEGVPAVPGPIVAQVLQTGLVVVLVMAALSVTTEYRFGTVRSTFQAVPRRPVALVAKAVVVATAAAVVGLVASVLAYAVGAALLGTAVVPSSAADWRVVGGAGAVFALGAVIAVSVGLLLRQTAGAVTLLLIWVLVLESLVGAIPDVGDDITRWLPFANAAGFLAGPAAPVAAEPGLAAPLSPLGSLLYLAVFATALFAVAVAVADRRDA